jgi:CRP/FNR family transcriptional regulator
MRIETDILITYGAATQKVKKGEFVFVENANPNYFYQIMDGSIKMTTMNQDGKEFIQGVFKEGESFGEPPLFVNRPYPSSAIALSDTILLKLSREKLLVLLEDRPSLAILLLQSFSERIYKKAVAAKILSCSDPEEKILTFLDRFKEEINTIEEVKVPYTRQQIADSTGLCVETVIRTLIKLCEEEKVAIKNHKVYY